MDVQSRQRAREIVEQIRHEPADRQQVRLRELCGDDEELLQASCTLLSQADDQREGDTVPETVSFRENTAWARKGRKADLAGETFAQFRLIEEIARGGMGVVYRAHDEKLDRIVALKMILDGRLASEDEVRRFQTEAQAAAGLDHPHIVPVYEAGEHDGRQFISMAYVPGDSLQKSSAGQPLAPRDAAALMKTIAEAIHYAHEHGVVHRDLKPSNVLLDENGQPRVMDFGLAKRTEVDTALTATGQIMGTPQYMAPEQAAGKIERVGTHSDIYALGAMLYCLLTGRPPFQAASLMETLNQVLQTEPASPRLLNPAVPKDLETICLRCLAKDPDDRFFTTAGELAEDLRRFLDEEPVRVRPVGRIVRFGRWCQRIWNRQRRWVIATAASILLAAGAVVGAVLVNQQADRKQRIAEISSRFDDALKQSQWSVGHVRKLEAIVEELEALSPEQGLLARRRLQREFADVVRQEIRRPRMSADGVARIESWLTLLAEHDKATADELRRELDARRTRRETVFQLRAPFDAANETLPNVLTEVAGQSLRRTPGPRRWQNRPEVLTKYACANDLQFEAVFDESWENASRVGLIINGQDKQTNRRGYHFVLRTPAPRDRKQPSASFKTVREDEGGFLLEIRRERELLRVQRVPAKVLPPGPLRLTAIRDGMRLSVQLGTAHRLEFIDIFPFPAQAGRRYGVVWPMNVKLRRMTASQRAVPAAASALEEGDRLYFQEEYSTARSFFRKQANESAGTTDALEARVKEALCLLAMKQDDAAANLLGTISYRPAAGDETAGRLWREIAFGQLLLIRIRQKDYQEADVLVQQMQFSRANAARGNDVMFGVTRQDMLRDVIGHLTASSGGANFLKPDPHRTRKLSLAMELLKAREVQNFTVFHIRNTLVRAHWVMGEPEQAMQTAKGYLAKRPLQLKSYDATLLAEYGWLARTAFPVGPRRTTAIREVLATVDRHLLARPKDPNPQRRYRKGLEYLLVERARLHCALGDVKLAARELEDYLRYPQQNYVYYSNACLLRGYLHADAGEREQALEYWRKAQHPPPQPKNKLDPRTGDHIAIMNFLIAAALSDDLSDAAVERVVLGFQARKYPALPSATLDQMTRRLGTRVAIVRGMWRSPEGQRLARRLVFRTVPFPHFMRQAVVLLSSHLAFETAFDKKPTVEQRKWIRNAFDRGVADVTAGKISLNLLQLGAVASAWGGYKVFWTGVSRSFPKHVQAASSYLLGLRYKKLGKHKDAEGFFRAAIKDAEDATLKRLAAAELKELKSRGSKR